MVNYNQSKIYKIVPTVDSEDYEVYFGSTTKKYLSQRMVEHRSKYKNRDHNKINLSLFKMFDKYGVENFVIVLLETVNCNSKDELLSRERHYIQSNMCINKAIPIRTVDERKQLKREYREINKEVIKEQRKEYRQKNKDEIKTKRSIKCHCECGVIYRYSDKARHCRSKKHQDFINPNQI